MTGRVRYVTGHVRCLGDRLSDRTRPVATPDASDVNQKKKHTVGQSIGRWLRPVRYHRTRPVEQGYLLYSTGRCGSASGHLSLCVRCECPVVSRLVSNGYVGLNWTRGSLGATGHVRYADRRRPVFTTGASGAASGQLDCSVRSTRVMPSEGV